VKEFAQILAEIVRVAVAMLMTALAGCAEPEAAPSAVTGLAPALEPSPSADLADEWYHGWVDQEDIASGTPVRDMILIMSMSGRDWRWPEGADGYVLRAVLLDSTDKPIDAGGELSAFLVQEPSRPEAKALYAWSLNRQETRARFRRGVVSGYLLQLDWGDRPPARGGTFMLVVRWTADDGAGRITRNIIFEDRLHEGRR